MTQNNISKDKTDEFKTLFLNLDEKGQEISLSILKSLEFAQSVMSSKEEQIREQTVESV